MFALPQIVGLPLLTSLDAGIGQFPTVGAMFAWLLLAALVGTGLGILREATRTPSTRVRVAPPIKSDPTDVGADYSHRAAA